VLAGRKKFSKYLTFFWRCDIIILENKKKEGKNMGLLFYIGAVVLICIALNNF
jgi:hypothetical protein